jgi:GNAT superfamily N-acetyltransferase
VACQGLKVNDFTVVTTHPDMILYIDSLQKKNAEALSFYPRQVFEREQENGRLFLGMLNGTPCGYIYVGAKGLDIKCHQVCIEYDARKRMYGAALVKVLEDYAKDAYTITLRCGFDLDANKFWAAMGYECVHHVEGGVRRMRTINVWRKQLISEMFQQIPLAPAVGKTSSAIWAKNKPLVGISQFSRGNKMEIYRESIKESHNATLAATSPQPRFDRQTKSPQAGRSDSGQIV